MIISNLGRYWWNLKILKFLCIYIIYIIDNLLYFIFFDWASLVWAFSQFIKTYILGKLKNLSLIERINKINIPNLK